MKLKIKETYLLLIIVMGLVSLSVYSTYALFTASTTITDVVSFNATLNTDNNLIEYEMITLSPGEVKMVEINVNNTYSTSLYYGAWYQIVSPSDTTDIVVGLTDDNTSSGSGALAKTSSIKLIVGLANNSSKTAVINIGTVGSITSNLNLPTGRNLIPEGFSIETTPNSPDLVQGLIPVYYNETTSKWVKADSTNMNNSWYNYKEKKWANAILVTSTNRSTYQSASAGTEISGSDILAFYVWIPRYKYKVWNKDKVMGTDTYNAQTSGIDIQFESDTASTGTISCTYSFVAPSSEAGSSNETCTGTNGDYYTHPAFTFGDDELRGFWIGKFELSSETPSADYGGGKSTILTPRILPNVTSWRYNYFANSFKVIQNMQSTNNIYGLSTDKSLADSHMIKNMEWGAVVYLTNSNYGRCEEGSCTEVTRNNCSGSYITGIGADTANALSSTTTCTANTNKYNGEKGVLASTTGNVYGVYDMNGGSNEYVMGNMSFTVDTYTFYPRISKIDDSWYTSNQKYVNTYAKGSTNTDQAAYNRARLGDATAEVVVSSRRGWNGNDANFPYSDYSWFKRGGDYGEGGLFYFNTDDGVDNKTYSTRAILVGLS